MCFKKKNKSRCYASRKYYLLSTHSFFRFPIDKNFDRTLHVDIVHEKGEFVFFFSENGGEETKKILSPGDHVHFEFPMKKGISYSTRIESEKAVGSYSITAFIDNDSDQ